MLYACARIPPIPTRHTSRDSPDGTAGRHDDCPRRRVGQRGPLASRAGVLPDAQLPNMLWRKPLTGGVVVSEPQQRCHAGVIGRPQTRPAGIARCPVGGRLADPVDVAHRQGPGTGEDEVDPFEQLGRQVPQVGRLAAGKSRGGPTEGQPSVDITCRGKRLVGRDDARRRRDVGRGRVQFPTRTSSRPCLGSAARVATSWAACADWKNIEAGLPGSGSSTSRWVLTKR